jgi:hypothetical protein
MIDSLNANGQSKRTVTHDKLYPMQTTVKITNITIPSKVRLTFDQIFEITYLVGIPYLDKSVNNMQIRNKDANTDPLYYGIDTDADDAYYTGQSIMEYTASDGSIVYTYPHDYLISYVNLGLTAKIDVPNLYVVVIGGGGGGGRDTGGDGNSPGGGGGGAYAHATFSLVKNDMITLDIGEGGQGGGYNGKDDADAGGTTTVSKTINSVILSYISASGGIGGGNKGAGAGGTSITKSNNGDITNCVYYHGGKGGDEAPGDNSTFSSADTGSTSYGNTVQYPPDVATAINNFFLSNVRNSVATDYTSYGGGGGGAGSQDESQYWTNGSGATNGTGGARGQDTDAITKGPGTPGFNGGGGGAGADNNHYGGNGGKGLVIMYVEAQYGDQYYM